MSSFLVCFGTGEGQTARIADHIVERLVALGHDATAVDVEEASTVDVTAYDAVVIGASIHVGSHPDSIYAFVGANRDRLQTLPSAFFQVSLSSASEDPDRQREAAGYVDEFVDATGWQPDHVALFAGAIRYSKYGFLKRLMMKQIAKEATGDTDTSRDYEYTDWAEVEAFADDVAAFVEGRLADAPATTTDTAPEA